MARRGGKDQTRAERPEPTATDAGRTARPQPPAGQLRESIGVYRVQSVLGRGGMGVVYRAIDPEGRPVAVKVVSERADADGIARFEREAKIQIPHPNIVQILDTGVDELGSPYIVFELLEGESLATRLSRGVLEAGEAVALAVEVCRGLEAAHSAGVIHRDLKPSNLFISKDGAIKILDFGVAYLGTDSTRITRTGNVVGTPSYLAPEQVRGLSLGDERTDVWALGAVIYELLSGNAPFRKESPLATMLAIIMADLVPLAQIVPNVPPSLAYVVERALSKRPEERWKTIAAMHEALVASDLTPGDAAAAESGAPRITPGETRVVSVLLGEEVHDALAFERAITKLGGAYIPLLGGRAIGLFGAESWEGDEASRALRAALALRGIAARISVASGRATSTGQGISGEVLARAETGCSSGALGITVDDATARALHDRVELEDTGDGIWRVPDRSPGPSLTRISPLGQALIGRAPEVAQIARCIDLAFGDRRAIALWIQGPAGIGKSRLRAETERLLEAREVPVVLGRAESHRRRAALASFSSALRARAGELAPIDVVPDVTSATLANSLSVIDRRRAALIALANDAIGGEAERKVTASFLGLLLDMPLVDTPELDAARGDPQLMSDRLALAIGDWIAGMIAKHDKLALLFEDVQWCDDASLRLIDELMDRFAGEPLLVAITARSELAEMRPEFLAGREVVRVEPRGLTSAEVEALASAISGQKIPTALAKALADRTSGNPLFVEQTMLALMDRGSLELDGKDLPVPLTIEAAVQSRLDHLPREEKEAAKKLAVFRRPFTADESRAVAASDELLRALGKKSVLVARARSQRGLEREYWFKSPLVADVAYRMVADDHRRGLHRDIAEHLATMSNAEPEDLGMHYELGGAVLEASFRYADATAEAFKRGDGASVMRCSERALALGVPDARRWELHMARNAELSFQGRRDEQERELELAYRFSTTHVERSRTLAERSWWMIRTGHSAEALAAAGAATDAARESGDELAIAHALGRHVVALVYSGRLEDAGDVLEEAMRFAAKGPVGLRGLAAGWRAQLAGARGEIGERLEAYRAASALYREAGDLRRAVAAETNLADAYNRCGAYEEAEKALRVAVDACKRVGHKSMQGYAHVNLGYALMMLYRIDEAIAELDRGSEIALAIKDARLDLLARNYRARLLIELAPEAAAVTADRAALDAEQRGMTGLWVEGLAIAARAKLRIGDLAGADARSKSALEERDRAGGVEEEEAEVFLVRADVLDVLGRGEEARAIRARGREYVETTARGIADETWRQKFRESVPAHRRLLGL